MSKKKLAHKQGSPTVTPTRSRSTEATKTSVHAQMASWFVVLLVLLPIIFSRDVQDPALTPRFILVSIFTVLFGLFFYLFKKTDHSFPYPPLVRYVFFAGLAFAVWNIVCLIPSINPTAGYYETLRLLLNLVILFFVIEMVAGNANSMLTISKVFVFIAIVQSLVGILQFYDIAFQNIPGANAKPYGLMANRNLFASAQVFVIPFVLYVLYAAASKWKYAAIIALVLLIPSLIIAQTRAAWLGTLVLMIVAAVLVLIYSAANRKKWLIGTGVTFVAIAAFAALILAGDSDGALRQELKERSKSLVNAASDTASSQANVNDRLVVWKKTAELTKKNMVTGVGLGNWKLNVLSLGGAGTSWAGGFFVPDRVHNVYLQTAAETGVPGLLIYLSFYILIAIIGLKVIIKPASEQQRIVVILMLAGLAAFAVDSMFSFPTERIEHMVYITLMSGCILGSFVSNKKQTPATRQLPKWFSPVVIVIALTSLVMAFKKHSFEKGLTYALAAENQNLPTELLISTAGAKNKWVNMDQLGISLPAKNAIAYKMQKNYPAAIEEMKVAMKLNPNSAMLYNNLGTMYAEMLDSKTAIKYYERALFFTPNFETVKKNLAMSYFNIGNYKGTVALLKSINIEGDQYLQGALAEATQLAATQK